MKNRKYYLSLFVLCTCLLMMKVLLSCNDENNLSNTCISLQYTIPPCQYIIDGKIQYLNSTCEIPIQNIEVNLIGLSDTSYTIDKVYTSSTGTYSIDIKDSSFINSNIYLECKDIDGTLNGGLFIDKTYINNFYITTTGCPAWWFIKEEHDIKINMTSSY